jgi:phage terminase small subunit
VNFGKDQISLKNSSLKAPSHLRSSTQQWWVSVCRDYNLGEHHVMLLTLAAEAWDRCCEAREIIAQDGAIVGGREAAVRPHPCIAIERDARIAFARLLAQLNLDAETGAAVDASTRSALRSTRLGGWKASNGQAA